MEIATSAAANVVSDIANSAVDSIWRQIQYAFNHRDNISKLKEQVDLLRDAEVSLGHRVEEATTRHGDEIEPGVDNWIKKARAATEEASKILADEDTAKKNKCFMGLCPDFKTRYKLSRNAEEQTQACVKIREQGKFDRVSYYQPPEHIIAVNDYEAFDSRTEVLEKIVEALKNPDIHMIGVYGMSGVGKTTLVKKVAVQVKEDKLFQSAVMAVVTHNPDPKSIQKEIAEKLNFEFGNVEFTRAAHLRQRLKKEEKILVILDDIWEGIDLEELGIPCGNDHKGCKILMTSRNRNVLSCGMGTQQDFRLRALPTYEAWNLFEKMVGDVVKDPIYQSVASQVAERCAGLPILLVAVAKALKERDLHVWKDALERLKRFDNEDIDKQVFSALELSYNFLKGEEIKSLFLLCAEFNPNFIDIAALLMYAFGLGIFKHDYTLENVRNRLYALLDELKACCLLMEHNDNGRVKMHDVVHHFAVSVAARDHHVFAAVSDSILTEWPAQDVFERCTTISLSYCKIPQLPEIFECPNLKSFTLENIDPSLKIPDEFFRGMKNLRVLDLTCVHFSSSLPSSLKFLYNLRTLGLYNCQLKDVAINIIGELKKLQVLCFWGSNIVRLPTEISKLTCLQLLNLKNCTELQVIPPYVLSRLTQLEELCMENSFVQWEVDRKQDEGSNANLVELKLLPKLSTLDIHITDVKMLPKDLFPGKLERFKIFIGDEWNWSGKYETPSTLKLKLNTSIQLEEGIKALIERTEDLFLDCLMGVKNILYELEPRGFPQMKHLHVQNSLEIHHLANSIGMGSRVAFPRLESLFLLNLINLEKICIGHLTAVSFSNLRKIDVANCDKMKNLFSFSVAKNLLRLGEIKVTDCESMEEIVIIEESEPDATQDESIKLTHLRKLKLEYLPQFTCFCFQLKPTSLPQTRGRSIESNEIVSERERGTSVPLFNDKVVFPNLDELELSSVKAENIWYDQFLEMNSHFRNLATLKVVDCENLQHLFSHSMVESLAQLEQLEINDCKFMETIIMAKRVGGEMVSRVLFPRLSSLKLKNLSKVKRFCADHIVDCPLLKVLWIANCPLLKAFISDSTSTKMEANGECEMNNSILFDEKVVFPNLGELRIELMPKLNAIWHNELQADSFFKLRSFEVHRCGDLLNIFPSSMLTRLQNLEDLTIVSCGSLEKVFDLINLSITQTQSSAAIYLRNLRSVQIWECGMLKSFFPISIAKSLLQLEKLDIYLCTVLEEIVAKEKGDEKDHAFQYPGLKSLNLQFLPELRSFYPGLHSLECPALETLIVYHCHRLQTFDSGVLHNPQETHKENQLPHFSFTKAISKLKMLSVNSEEAKMICQGKVSADFFDKIKTLHLCCFHDEDKFVDFPFDLLHKFHNLERLKVQRCNFEEIFTCGIVGDEKYNT